MIGASGMFRLLEIRLFIIVAHWVSSRSPSCSTDPDFNSVAYGSADYYRWGQSFFLMSIASIRHDTVLKKSTLCGMSYETFWMIRLIWKLSWLSSLIVHLLDTLLAASTPTPTLFPTGLPTTIGEYKAPLSCQRLSLDRVRCLKKAPSVEKALERFEWYG